MIKVEKLEGFTRTNCQSFIQNLSGRGKAVSAWIRDSIEDDQGTLVALAHMKGPCLSFLNVKMGQSHFFHTSDWSKTPGMVSWI